AIRAGRASIRASGRRRCPTEPRRRPAEAVRKRYESRHAESRAALRDVENAAHLLAALRRSAPCGTRRPARGGDEVVELVHRRLDTAAHVDHAGDPSRGGRQVRPHDVGHEDEVARLLAVSVDEALLAGEELFHPDADDAGLAPAVLT